jgi:hypothetical protein
MTLNLNWSFNYIYAAPTLLAISMAMRIRWYGAEHIA